MRETQSPQERLSLDHLTDSRKGLLTTGYRTHCEMQERVFWDCRRQYRIEEELKARQGIVKHESGLGKNKHRRILGGGKMANRGQVHINGWLASMVVQPCPGPE